MEYSDYVVLIVLAVFVLYGLGNFIAAPVVARRAYRELGLIDCGKSLLESPSTSKILLPLATSHLYHGQYRGHAVEHCQAYPRHRRTFTLSKATRKFNQSRRSLTRIQSKESLPAVCLLPTADVKTALRMLNDPGVDLSGDDDFVNRYHLRCEDPDKIRPLVFKELREFLLQKELIKIECVENTILIERNWPDEKIKARIQEELDYAVVVVEQLESTRR